MNAAHAYGPNTHHGYIDPHHPSHSSGPSYPQYHHPAPVLQPALSAYQPQGHQYFPYPPSVTSPASHQPSYAQPTHMSVPPPAAAPGSSHEYTHRIPDTTGQQAPPGVKPKVTATLWEDEGTLCFQVEDNGICVARREDNHMINGTKLLNVASMTRGRRDGILKSEKIRNVIKIGPMHLKGVWIPFDRALEFANKEKITERLYPLFVHNVGALLHQPTNQTAQISVRRNDSQNQSRFGATSQAPSASLPHQHAVSNSANSQPSHPLAPHSNANRPGIDRAHTFPTPPTSATSLIGMNNPGGSYDSWSGSSVANVPASQPLPLDTTHLNNPRSMPNTPATTPPDNTLQSLQPYNTSQPYDNSRQAYSVPPSQYGHYNQALQPYSQSKSDMAPPARTGTQEGLAETKVEEAEQSGEYTASASTYGADRGNYAYNSAHVSPEIKGSPSQRPGSGRATPRSIATPQSQWQQTGYGTPQRTQTLPSSSLSYVIDNSRATNGVPAYPVSTSYTNGTTTSNKRGRDEDDDDEAYTRPASQGADSDSGAIKRRRTARESSAGVAIGSGNLNRPRSTLVQRQ